MHSDYQQKCLLTMVPSMRYHWYQVEKVRAPPRMEKPMQVKRPICQSCGKRVVERRRHPTELRWRKQCRKCARPAMPQLEDIGPAPLCKECGQRPCKRRPKSDASHGKWHAKCTKCQGELQWIIAKRSMLDSYRQFKNGRNTCETCGFIAQHPCQLDVDHKDGNHHNDEVANLQVLCANCHRLKTMRERKQGAE